MLGLKVILLVKGATGILSHSLSNLTILARIGHHQVTDITLPSAVLRWDLSGQSFYGHFHFALHFDGLTQD